MRGEIKETLNEYLKFFPSEEKGFEILNKQLQKEEELVDRKNFTGHVTASGIVLSSSGKMLVLFHNSLKMYLQPGGHVEVEDSNLIEAAKREVEEESGIKKLELHPWCVENKIPILVDSHLIPENSKKEEDEHYHHDFMFIFMTENEEVELDKSEVSDFKWVDVSKLSEEDSACVENLEVSIQKMKKLKII